MALGKNIDYLLKLNDWTQKDLEKRSGVKNGTISALKVRNSVRSEFVPQLAAAFGVSVEALISDDIEDFCVSPADQKMTRKAVNVSSGIALIPLLDRKTAGMHERYTTGGEKPPATHAHPGQVEPGLFAYQVDDDLMEPIIQKGCIATISTRLTPRHGMCVLIQDGEDTYIRRLVVDGGAQLIESPRYPARPLPGRIIGVVHQVSTVFVNLDGEGG